MIRFDRSSKRRRLSVAVIALSALALVASSGCDSMLGGLGSLAGLGGLGDWGYGGYDYGFVPDYDTVQDVMDYRTDVYDAANDAWSDYIRM